MSATPVPANGQVKRRGRPFENGNAGRKPGSKNRATLIAMSLLANEEEALIRKAIELAKAGDRDMIKFLLGRILPKERAVSLELPAVETAADAVAALAVVTTAVSTGEITPSEGAAFGSLIGSCSRAMDIAELAKKVEAIETRLKNGTSDAQQIAKA